MTGVKSNNDISFTINININFNLINIMEMKKRLYVSPTWEGVELQLQGIVATSSIENGGGENFTIDD